MSDQTKVQNNQVAANHTTVTTTSQEPSAGDTLAVLNQVLQSSGGLTLEEVLDYIETQYLENGEQETQESTSQTIEQSTDVEQYILKMAGLRNQQNEETFNDENDTEEDSESGSTIQQGTGMQAVFDMQGNICALDGIATESNEEQSEEQVEMNDALQDSANDQYEKLQKKLKKLEKESKKSSFWGFVKGLGSLMKDINKMTKDLTKDVMTGSFNKIGSDMSSDANTIKNNAAVVDIGNMVKLVGQVDKMGFDALKDCMTGKFHSIGKDEKADFSQIEKNPSLSLALQLAAYVAAAAVIVGTDGAATVAVVAVVIAMSQADTLNKTLGGAEKFLSNTLQMMGIPASVANVATQIPSFNEVSDGLAKVLEDCGVSKEYAKPIADVTVIAVATLASGGAGGVGIGAMAAGTALSSMAGKIAGDFGASGQTKEWVTLGLQITGALVAFGGGAYATSGSSAAANTAEKTGAEAAESAEEEAAESAEQSAEKQVDKTATEQTNTSSTVKSVAQGIQRASAFIQGVFSVMTGFQTIDIANLQQSATDTQGKLQQLYSQEGLMMQLLSNTSDQLQNINDQYSAMIDSFGAIAAPGIATAEALA